MISEPSYPQHIQPGSRALLSYGVGEQILFDEATARNVEHLLDYSRSVMPMVVESLSELSVRILENFVPGGGVAPLDVLGRLKIMFTTFTQADLPEEERQVGEAILLGAEFVEAILKVRAAGLSHFACDTPPVELAGALLQFNRQLCLLGCSSTEMSRVEYLGVLLQIQAGKALEGLAEDTPTDPD